MPKIKKQTKIVPAEASTSAPVNYEFGREMDRNDPHGKPNKENSKNNVK